MLERALKPNIYDIIGLVSFFIAVGAIVYLVWFRH
jgi:hypothetical protein